ncbi:MAG: hypothetical protein RRY36_01475 [Bacteroidaceae bacterium]
MTNLYLNNKEMNMMHVIFKHTLSLFVGLLLPITVVAQISPFETEYFKDSEYRLSTNNASGLVLGKQLVYSDVSLGIDYSKGSFHRPQQAAQNTNYLFSAEGAIMMGKYYLIGGFNFKQSFEKDVRFTSIFDSYRGTPYIIADSTGGDWQKQSYNMWVKGSSPVLFNLISFGLDGKLAVGRGAKKIDPRPQANTNTIQVSPSFTLVKSNHSLGADFTYQRFKENTNIILYDAGVSQKIYFLKGMGQYTYDIFSGNDRERQYEGDSYGAGAQYGYRSERFNLLVNGSYRNYVENANDIENNKPRQRGRLYETVWKADLHADIYSSNSGAKHVLVAAFEDMKRSGREIIQVFNPSPTVNAWETDSEAPGRWLQSQRTWQAGYDLFLLTQSRSTYVWKFALRGSLSDLSDAYASMNSLLDFKSGNVTVEAFRNLTFKNRQYLQVGVNGTYRAAWNVVSNYLPREASDLTITDGLVKRDRDILTQNYYQIGVQAMYGYTFRSNGSIYLKGKYSYLDAKGGWNRNSMMFSIGYNF